MTWGTAVEQRLQPETAMPKKMSRGKKWAMWGLTATGVFITLSIVTVNALVSGITNAADKDLPPAPGSNNSGELVPGQTGTTEQPAPYNREGRGTATYKFLAEDGKTFQTHEQLVDSISVPVDTYPDKLSAQKRFYELIEKRSNYEPTEEEVRNNLDIPSDRELTANDFWAAAKLYRDAHNSLFENESGGLFKFLDKLGSDVYDVQVSNYMASGTGVPKAKYKANLEYPSTYDRIIITDNVTETSIPNKDATAFLTGTYELSFIAFGPDQVTENNKEVWKFGDRVVVTKQPRS